jgi:flagellar operon protein
MVDKILPGQPLPGATSVRPATPGSTSAPATGLPVADVSFRQLLDDTLRTQGGVKFSAHALKRLESRGISLSPPEVSAVEQALDRAAAKGSRDSLLLGQQFAMVVNVPSRTVITALDQQQLSENVVTNIDSAVWVPGL